MAFTDRSRESSERSSRDSTRPGGGCDRVGEVSEPAERNSDTMIKIPIMKTTRRPNLMASVLSLTCYCVLSGHAALAREQAPQKAAGGTITLDLAELQKPWTGDLDGMIERRVIRVLTVNSKTIYFVDKGVQRGIAVEAVRLVEEELNKKLTAEKKLKHKNLKIRAMFIPVRRDELLPGLIAGKGDIAAAHLTITPERQKLVDFTAAGMSNVSQVVVSGPASPTVASLDDLSGKDVFVRKSSSYYESLVALNERFTADKKPPVILKEAPETLEDEDLIEMLNAGLIRLHRQQAHGGLLEQIFRSSPCTTTSRFAPAARSRGRL